MLNRKNVWRKFKEEGILDSSDEKVQELVEYVRTHPLECWADLIPVYREQFYSTFDTIVPILVNMKDPVVNSALIRNLDPSKKNELDTLTAIADTSDPREDPVSFKRMARLDNAKLNQKLVTRPLTAKVSAMLTLSRDDD